MTHLFFLRIGVIVGLCNARNMQIKFQAERLKARRCQFLRAQLVEKFATLSHTCLLLQTR